ncbi:MAG: L-seryl-tRNA(Sec) selenium transferase [Firmicutes bacterium]|nr:L-seryl-tRNA(Sec) selenium transferase [Bacillota bacterium]
MPREFVGRYLRLLPAVDRVLSEKILLDTQKEVPRAIVAEAVKEVLDEKRSIISGAALEKELDLLNFSPSTLAKEALDKVSLKMEHNLRPVLNATGVLLHTNLGRAPLAGAAIKAIKEIGVTFSNLELSLKDGKRSSRFEHVEELFCRMTGAEAAFIVNNNAGAVFLTLNTLAAGKEVVVSRGELVEIGGSFRLPDVMSSSGACLTEVGTTNRTYLKDYQKAIGESTALLLKVHTSNFKISGFTAAVPSSSLVRLGRKKGIYVMEDLGSGVLLDLSKYGLPYEPMVQDSVKAGVDVVTFSGDKLLGGPQAGVIVGKSRLLERIKSNQLARALRVDKFTLAAMEATLRLYLDEQKALQEIPILRMLTASADLLQHRAEKIACKLKNNLHEKWRIDISQEKSRVGGGSLPSASLPSWQVSLQLEGVNAHELARKLRGARPPVIARVRDQKVLLDFRSLSEEEDLLLLKAIMDTFGNSGEQTEVRDEK